MIEFLPPRAGRKAQDRTVQSEKREVVAVNTVAFRRTRTSIAWPPEVVLPARTDGARPEAFGQGMHVGWDIPKEPVGPRPGWCVGIIQDQCEALCSLRFACHSNAGDESSPSQVERFGMDPPSSKPFTLSVNAI